jgi:hypothetical protein
MKVTELLSGLFFALSNYFRGLQADDRCGSTNDPEVVLYLCNALIMVSQV